jgi:hypothetical protein
MATRGRRAARLEEWKGRCHQTRGRGEEGIEEEEEMASSAFSDMI